MAEVKDNRSIWEKLGFYADPRQQNGVVRGRIRYVPPGGGPTIDLARDTSLPRIAAARPHRDRKGWVVVTLQNIITDNGRLRIVTTTKDMPLNHLARLEKRDARGSGRR